MGEMEIFENLVEPLKKEMSESAYEFLLSRGKIFIEQTMSEIQLTVPCGCDGLLQHRADCRVNKQVFYDGEVNLFGKSVLVENGFPIGGLLTTDEIYSGQPISQSAQKILIRKESEPFVTFTKKVKSYVSEESLKDLVQAGVLQSYELKHSSEGSEVTLTFQIESH